MHCPRSLKENRYFIKASDFIKTPVIIGQGAYGVVYKGTYASELCALKYLRSYLFGRVSAKEYTMRQFEQECEFAKQLSNPYIVRFIGVSFDDHVPVLVTELMECSLTEVLDCRLCSLPYHREINIALGIARGLDYLHNLRSPVVHRDLSSNNVLLSSDHSVKIADLGVAKCVDAISCSPMPGTTVYMPPEVTQPSPLSVAIDLFSYGVLLVQLETRKYPEPADKVERIVQEVEDSIEQENDVEKMVEGDRKGVDSWVKGKDEEEMSKCMSKSNKEDTVVESMRNHYRTRTEIERRSNHISLMDKTGVFHKIVQCYLQEDPKTRRKTPLREVINWLEKTTNTLQYSDSILNNPEVPLEHKTNNHKSCSLSSVVSDQLSSSSSVRHHWWQRLSKNKSWSTDESGYHSQENSTKQTQVGTSHQSSGEWVKVEAEQVPSDGGRHGLLGSAVYNLNRLSNVLGLTTTDEDDMEYRQRVMKSL